MSLDQYIAVVLIGVSLAVVIMFGIALAIIKVLEFIDDLRG